MPASIQARLHSLLVGCLLGGLRAAILLGLLVALGPSRAAEATDGEPTLVLHHRKIVTPRGALLGETPRERVDLARESPDRVLSMGGAWRVTRAVSDPSIRFDVDGVQCGGSDAFSGVTANPAVGHCTDLLVRAGASVMFSEVTEVRDGIDQLTSRATTPEVAEAMIREMA